MCSPWPEKYIDWWININRFETVWELQPSTLPIQEIISLQPFHCFHTKTGYWSKCKELSWLALLGWYNFITHGYSKSKSALRKLISTTVTRQSTWCILLKNHTKIPDRIKGSEKVEQCNSGSTLTTDQTKLYPLHFTNRPASIYRAKV